MSSANATGMLPLNYYVKLMLMKLILMKIRSRRSAPIVIARKSKKRPIGRPRKKPNAKRIKSVNYSSSESKVCTSISDKAIRKIYPLD